MTKCIFSKKWRGEPVAMTIMDTVYANGAVQPRLFSESEL